MADVIRSYRDLKVWQRAFQVGLWVYRATELMPTHERFGLISQLRRGAVSVSSNIAEGYGRGSRADYLRFLKVARGALYEIDTQLLFAVRLKYLAAENYDKLAAQIETCGRLLAGLIRRLESSDDLKDRSPRD